MSAQHAPGNGQPTLNFKSCWISHLGVDVVPLVKLRLHVESGPTRTSGGAGSKGPEEGDDEFGGTVGKDHNDIAIGDASLMELAGQDVGRLINLLVVESPLGCGGGGRFRDARRIGIL